MFKGRFTKEGGIGFGVYERAHLKEFILKNPNMPFELVPLLPESKKQRGFFEGAVVPLMTFYQEGMDHRSHKDRAIVREWLKLEFNGELITVGGKTHRIAKSTKRELNSGFLERVIEYMVDNYAPPMESLSPAKFKDWRDRIFPYGGADNFIDYLQEIAILKTNEWQTTSERER